MNNTTHNTTHNSVRITAVASAFLVLGALGPGIGTAANTTQKSAETSSILVATQGMDRRQERRANRQDCRQEEGLVGKDKRDCKQEGRAGDPAEEDGETGKPEETDQPEQTDKG